MYRKETPFWIWLCENKVSNNSISSQTGELFTAILDRLKTDNFNMDAVMTAFQNLVSQMEQYSFDADKIVKDKLSQAYFDIGDVQLLRDIVQLKYLGQNIKTYVEMLSEATVEHFDTLRNLSRELFEDIKQVHSIIQSLKIDKAQLEFCIANLRSSILSLIKSFKENIIKHHYEFFRGNNPIGYRAINLGYIVHCIQFMEKVVNKELSFQPLNHNCNYLEFPERMCKDLLDWYEDLSLRLDYLTEAHEDLDEPIAF